MKKLEILKYPHPVLMKEAEPVTEFNDELKKLVEDMVYTMLIEPGSGLAAPQVGVSKRLFVVNGEYFDKPNTGFAIINPRIVKTSGKISYEEACLSVPGIRANLERPKDVTLEGLDIDGNPVKYEVTDWQARIFLHENDHLDGRLFFERLSGLKKNMIQRKIRKSNFANSGKSSVKSKS